MPINAAQNKRSTLSAPSDPRTDPRVQKAAQEEHKVRQALRELRKRNNDLSEGIRSLESAIGEPAFRRLMEQVTSAETSLAHSSEQSSCAADDLKRQQNARCRRLLLPILSKFVEKEQKLHFGTVDLRQCRPKLFAAANSTGPKVSIVGPPDVKKRSCGSLRVADQLLSLDCTPIGELRLNLEQPNRPAEQHQNNNVSRPENAPNGSESCAQQHHQLLALIERHLDEAARTREPPLVVFGVLRHSAKIMALAQGSEQDAQWVQQRAHRKDSQKERIVELTGDWVQVQIVHMPNEPEGLGFGIVGGHSTGVVVKSIIRGSVADKDQRLRPGDRILQIGHISTQGLNSQQVAALLRQQDAVVQITVGRPTQLQESEQDTPLCWTMATRAALTAATLEEEVHQRLEAIAGSTPVSSCNGVHQRQASQQPIEAINEGTEYPDQLARLNPLSASAHDPLNRPSTSQSHPEQENVERPKRSMEKGTTTGAGSEEPLNEASKRRRHKTSRGQSNDNPSCSSSSERRSLRQLQEMALTSFCRDKWLPGTFKEVDVELERDTSIGLGITVAGYVYKKEEISGVFIKSLIPQSSAHLSKQIQLHDLIVEVNGRHLEGLSHAESVRTLIKSGHRVRLKLIRFDEGTPQAKCLKMLHEQEMAAASQADSAGSSSSATGGGPVLQAPQTQQQYEHSLVDYKTYWCNRLGADFDVIVVDVQPDDRVLEDGGLGIEWQGTVDVCEGNQLCSHHFIESLRKEGPAARTGVLKAGDELLQVNEVCLHGESFVKVRKALAMASHAQANNQFVRLIFCRKAEKEHLNFVLPSTEQCLPLAYPLLASMMANDEHFIKAKSELKLCDWAPPVQQNGPLANGECRRRHNSHWRSRSLENLCGLAVWHCVPVVVTLQKDAKGLGFSVADYQDPLHPAERVIVIRSLVPGGAAQADGRIVPGDRLLFVNGEDLSSSSLERAVDVLKTAPIGRPVRLGIAKPVPIEQCRLGDTVPLISRSERLLAKSHSPRGRRRTRGRGGQLLAQHLFTAQHLLNSGADPCSAASSQEEIWVGGNYAGHSLNPQLYFPSSGSTTPLTPRSQISSAMQAGTAVWTPCSSRSLSPCASPASSLKGSWSYDITLLPSHLERHIKVLKGPLALGVVLDAGVDKAINGCVVRSICSKKAVGRDSRIQPGDHLVKINGESLRNVTNAQARAILCRANLVGAQCGISYITAADAKLWKERFPYGAELQHFVEKAADESNANRRQSQTEQLFSRLSPKVYPKFYRSAIFDETRPGEEEPESTSAAEEEVERPEEPTSSDVDCATRAFIDAFVKNAFCDALFDIHFIASREQQRPLNLNEPIVGARSLRSASVALPQQQHKVGAILRRASSSLKRKKPPSVPSSEAKRMSGQRQSADMPRTPMNFWSEPRTVVLNRGPNETFGISIVGGRVEVSQRDEGAAASSAAAGGRTLSNSVCGIFIKSVVADSPAGRSCQLFMGDRVLRVNDSDLTNTTHEHAVQVIKNAQNPVRFTVQSLQSLRTFVPTSGAKRPSVASVADECVATTSQQVARGALDTESAAALERDPHDREQEDAFHYTERKVARKYASLPGVPVLIRLGNIPAGGLGLILSTRCGGGGSTQQQDANNAQMGPEESAPPPPVIVVGVKSDSPLPLKVGDELLEINGKVLFGLSHREATEKIRCCCEHNCLSLLVLRKRDQSEEHEQQQQQLAEETLDEERHSEASLPQECSKSSNVSECELDARNIVSEVLQSEMAKIEAEDAAQENNNNNNNVQPCAPRARTASDTVAPKSSGGTLSLNSNNAVAGSTETNNSRKRSWQMEAQQSAQLQKVSVQVGQETLIEIDKEGKGLGLSIVGGSDTVLGTVVIHEVYPDGAAAIDGRLKPGDQVLEVNSTSLRGIPHEQAISLLRRTPAKVRLLIYRDVNLQMSMLDPAQIYNILVVELTKKSGKGLGISIVGRKNEPGVYISEIVKGGVADADGRLMQGDQILEVNSQNVANCLQEDVATILKTSTGKVTLKVGRWKLTETAQRVRCAQPPPNSSTTALNAGMPLQQQQNTQNESEVGERAAATNGGSAREPPPPAPMPMGGGKLPPPTLQITLHDENNQQQLVIGAGRSDLSPVSEEDLKSIAETCTSDQTTGTTTSSSQRRPLSSQVAAVASPSTASSSAQQSPQPTSAAVANTVLRADLKEAGCDAVLIVLKKEEGQQWGMGIGKRPRGILITSLQPGSSAAEKLAIGDRIMAVNGHAVSTQHSAVTHIRSSGNSVALQVSRPNKPFLAS